MRELDLKGFEDEVAKGCDARTEHRDDRAKMECGSGYCKLAEEDRCVSVVTVRKWLKGSETAGVVLFRNQDMWASGCGKSSCVVVGEGKTYGTVEECEGKWLNDLPSQRQYAECFVRRTA